MPAYSSGRGTSSTFTQTCTSGRFSSSSITLATYSEAISVHTRSLLFSNSSGPGCRLKIWKAASMIAAVADVGSPSVSSGTSVPENDALLAASGPATPSIAPSPHSASRFEPALGRVGEERRHLRAARRQRAEREADPRTAQPRLPRAPPVRAREPAPRALDLEHLLLGPRPSAAATPCAAPRRPRTGRRRRSRCRSRCRAGRRRTSAASAPSAGRSRRTRARSPTASDA